MQELPKCAWSLSQEPAALLMEAAPLGHPHMHPGLVPLDSGPSSRGIGGTKTQLTAPLGQSQQGAKRRVDPSAQLQGQGWFRHPVKSHPVPGAGPWGATVLWHPALSPAAPKV